MHRYQSDLLARMRTDYVHEQQERYRTQLMHIADAIDHASASERVKLTKQQKKLQEQSPVSYTHLDVYKRQGQCCAAEPHGAEAGRPSRHC